MDEEAEAAGRHLIARATRTDQLHLMGWPGPVVRAFLLADIRLHQGNALLARLSRHQLPHRQDAATLGVR